MNETDPTPKTWHYGLVARYWAEHNTGGPEIAYYLKQIETYGGPALDAGCGAGRLLIPFLQAGLDVDGCDLSTDMLAMTRARADREGLHPRLYQQALHQLDLPRRYQTIVACGVFGIGGTRQQDFQALQRLFQQLQPGGVLLVDTVLPYADTRAWPFWTKAARTALPEAWPEHVGKVPPTDGAEYELYSRILDFDPLEQRITRQMRALLWQEGQVVEEQVYLLTENYYFRNELGDLLERAGFAIEAVQGDYTFSDATPDTDAIVFVARKG